MVAKRSWWQSGKVAKNRIDVCYEIMLYFYIPTCGKMIRQMNGG